MRGRAPLRRRDVARDDEMRRSGGTTRGGSIGDARGVSRVDVGRRDGRECGLNGVI